MTNKEEKLEQIMEESEKTKGQAKKTQAIKIVNSVEQEGVKLFHDEYNEPYMSLYGDGRKILSIRSKSFKSWLAYLAWEKMGKAINSATLQSSIQILEGKACYKGSLHQLYVRVARQEGTIFYDLGDGSVVKVNKSGWEIIDDPPILFKRFSHQKPQIHPKTGGDLKDILNFVNLSDQNDQLLFQIITASNFIPEFPHVVLVLHGVQGSAKSTLARVLKELTDPSIVKVLTSSDSLREFVQTASHHWLIPIDNLSYLPTWLSDAISRACTGDGFIKRQLYSDDDDVIYNFQRVISLNGINLVVNKPDLLQRSVLLELETIPDHQRREESEFWKKFEEKKPYILGSIFDILVKALNEKEKIKLIGYPRMADFTKWGCAISRAMGFSETMFLNAYYSNINRQNEAALEASPIALAIIELMNQQNPWQGTPTILLGELEMIAEDLKINKKSKSWPEDPTWLWKRIKKSSANLQAIGIEAKRGRGKDRIITLKKVQKNAVNSVDTVGANSKPQVPQTNAVAIPTVEPQNTDSKTGKPEDTLSRNNSIDSKDSII